MSNIKPLLYTEGSLTQALRQSFDEPIRVEVLREVARPCQPEEAKILQDNQLWQREVLITAGRPLILARTRISLHHAQHQLKTLTELGNTPLGDWLFNQTNLHRLSFTVDEENNRRDAVYELDGATIWIQESFL